MASKAGTIERLTLELSRALESMSGFINRDIVVELGFFLPESIVDDPTLIQAFENLSNRIAELPSVSANLSQAIADENVPQIIAAGVQLFDKIKLVFEAIEQVASVFTSLASGLGSSEQAALLSFAESFPRKLLDYIVVTYLESRSRIAVHGLALIGLLDWSREVELDGSSRPEHIQKTIRFDRLSQLVSGPADLFLDIYGWGSPIFDGVRLFQTVQNMIVEGVQGTADIIKIDDQEPILEAYIFALQRDIALNPPGLNAEFRFPLEPQLSFVEDVALTFPWIQKLNFTANAGANLAATVAPPLNIQLSTAGGAVSLDISGDLSTEQATEPFTLLGLTGASRIAARHFGITAGVTTSANGTGAVSVSPSLGLRLQDAQVNLDFTGADSFIQQTVSRKELASNFSVSATWSMAQGLLLQGSGGLEINLPAHADLGVAKVNNLFFKATFDADFEVEASAGITAQLGPLTATINRIGLLARLTFPENNSGNLGPVNLDFAFKPPTGVGLSVDGGGFKGGGFLEFEPEEARYSGNARARVPGPVHAQSFWSTEHPTAERTKRLLAADRHQFRVYADSTGTWFQAQWCGRIAGPEPDHQHRAFAHGSTRQHAQQHSLSD